MHDIIKVSVCSNAESDLRNIAKTDMAGAARVAAIIQALREESDLQGKLLSKYAEHKRLEISTWVSLYRLGYDIYRVKELKPDSCSQAHKYRIIYGYILPKGRNDCFFIILAIVNRNSFNYEPDSDISKRIIYDYENA